MKIGLLTLAVLVSKLIFYSPNLLIPNNFRDSINSRLLLQAANKRFRPILMTTLAIVFDMFPLVFAQGAGATSRFDIGIVIMVGMLFLYYYLSSNRVTTKNLLTGGEGC